MAPADISESRPRYQLDLVCGRTLRSSQTTIFSSFSKPSATATNVVTSCQGVRREFSPAVFAGKDAYRDLCDSALCVQLFVDGLYESQVGEGLPGSAFQRNPIGRKPRLLHQPSQAIPMVMRSAELRARRIAAPLPARYAAAQRQTPRKS